MPWGALVGGGMSLLGGLFGGAGASMSADDMVNMYKELNPFFGYEAGFSQRLNDLVSNSSYANTYTALAGTGQQYANLLSNPDSIYSSKVFNSMMGQGTNAVNSAMAAQGLNGSGNQLAALQNYGQSLAGNYFNSLANTYSQGYQNELAAGNTYFNQLATLSGVNNQASAAGTLNNMQNAQQQGINSMSQGITGALSSLFGGLGSSYNTNSLMGSMGNSMIDNWGNYGMASGGGSMTSMFGPGGYTGNFGGGSFGSGLFSL